MKKDEPEKQCKGKTILIQEVEEEEDCNSDETKAKQTGMNIYIFRVMHKAVFCSCSAEIIFFIYLFFKAVHTKPAPFHDSHTECSRVGSHLLGSTDYSVQ